MARKPRVEFEGAVYHVIVRGNHRRDIFATEATAWPTLIGSSITESAIAARFILISDDTDSQAFLDIWPKPLRL